MIILKRRINNFHFIIVPWLLILIACSFRGKNKDDILVYIEKSERSQITLTFKNTSEKKFILPRNILLTGDILQFKNAEGISFIGVVVDRTYPHHFSNIALDWDKFLDNDCYLNDTVNYRVVLPNHSFSLEYDVYENYEGLKENESYLICYKFSIEKEYSDYCPLIWSGTIESNMIRF